MFSSVATNNVFTPFNWYMYSGCAHTIPVKYAELSTVRVAGKVLALNVHSLGFTLSRELSYPYVVTLTGLHVPLACRRVGSSMIAAKTERERLVRMGGRGDGAAFRSWRPLRSLRCREYQGARCGCQAKKRSTPFRGYGIQKRVLLKVYCGTRLAVVWDKGVRLRYPRTETFVPFDRAEGALHTSCRVFLTRRSIAAAGRARF